MSFAATTISEHLWNQGKNEGIVQGEIKGQIKILETLYQSAILTKEQFDKMIIPLKKQLQEIQSQLTIAK